MRIESINAVAFGPFTDETLELASGLNVVYGPNESGKSSWHAAIYAALCGMKKTRGQPTREDRAFAARHRPWRGAIWRVTAVIALDDGRSIEIEQGLGSGGRSVARDRSTKKPLAGEIVRAGAVDATTLLGLARETAMATLFIRQADMLRVLSDAAALQEYLERAAATCTAGTTADEALARIAAYRRERVGLLRAGSRGALAIASRQLREAREALDRAEERFENYQELLARRHLAEAKVAEVELLLREVVEHEKERERREQWVEIRVAERRLELARRLADELSAGSQDGSAEKQLVDAVVRALAAVDARPAEPPPLEGATAEKLDRELAQLPDAPDGDLVPSRVVTSLVDRWRTENQRLAAHEENEPSLGSGEAPSTAPSEFRRLADDLELPVPDIDPTLIDEIERHRKAATVPSALPQAVTPSPPPDPVGGASARLLRALGGGLAVAGVVLVVLGQPILGVFGLLLGVIIAVVGAIKASRIQELPARIPVPTSIAEPMPRSADYESSLTRLEARLALQQEAQAQARRRRDSSIARIIELGLQPDAGTLRRLAAEGETEASAKSRHGEWRRRRADLEAGRSSAAEALRDALSVRGIGSDEYGGLQQAVEGYTQACIERAQIAREADRRDALEAQLANRRSAEASRDHQVAARRSTEQRLREVAREAGCEAASIDDMSDRLRGWVQTQGELDEARQDYESTAARLDQLLDGLTLAELEGQVAELIADAGDPPSDEAVLKDRSEELEVLQSSRHQRRDMLAGLVGQMEGAEGHLVDVSQAIEAEGRASAEVDRLTVLAEDLDLASEILGDAQEKVHADIAPVLNETIRPWVSRITRDRYDDIRVDPATLEIEAHEASGQFRPVTVLSHGTAEQLFLLLRLALAQRLTTTGEKAPLILDDITVQSDAPRTVAALELLHDLSAEHQVVLFSQEDEVFGWAKDNLVPPSDRLVQLEPH